MSGLAVARHMGDDDLGVGLQHRFIGQAPLGVRARLGTLHPDITRLDELEEDVFALGGTEIQGRIQLVASFLDPGGGDLAAAIRGRQLHAQVSPGGVPLARAFDLDHLGAHFGR